MTREIDKERIRKTNFATVPPILDTGMLAALEFAGNTDDQKIGSLVGVCVIRTFPTIDFYRSAHAVGCLPSSVNGTIHFNQRRRYLGNTMGEKAQELDHAAK